MGQPNFYRLPVLRRLLLQLEPPGDNSLFRYRWKWRCRLCNYHDKLLVSIYEEAERKVMNEWMNEWKNERMNEWLNERMNERMKEWMNEWMKEWMNEKMNERKKERMNEWMNESEWLFYLYRVKSISLQHREFKKNSQKLHVLPICHVGVRIRKPPMGTSPKET